VLGPLARASGRRSFATSRPVESLQSDYYEGDPRLSVFLPDRRSIREGGLPGAALFQ
jgi:hypothetical protein